MNKYKWKGPPGYNPDVGEVYRGMELIIDDPLVVSKLKNFMTPVKPKKEKEGK